MSGIPSRWLACLVAACLVLAAGALRQAPAFAADPQAGAKAEAFVASLADDAIAALTTAGASREQRENRARELLARYFAVDTIGRWVLGRYWQQATPAQQTDYLTLFEDLIVTTYVDRFSRYSGERLTVSRSLVDEASGGGYDGLMPGGRNENEGAESTLALLSTRQQADRVRADGGLRA